MEAYRVFISSINESLHRGSRCRRRSRPGTVVLRVLGSGLTSSLDDVSVHVEKAVARHTSMNSGTLAQDGNNVKKLWPYHRPTEKGLFQDEH